MKLHESIMIAALNCALSSIALAQETKPVEHWTLEQILTRASEHTPEIKAQGKDIERAENLALQAGKWDNPEGSLSYGPMTQAGVSGITLDATLKQSIPIFGQKAVAQRLGEQNTVTARLENQKQLLAIRHEVVRLAYRLAALDEQAKHVSHRKEKMNLIAQFLETRPFASPSQAVEKSLILNRLREIEEKFLEISFARDRSWQNLNVFLDLNTRVAFDAKWIEKPLLPEREKFSKLFRDQNPELKRQQSLISAASIAADQAGKKAFPDIRVGAGYNKQTADFPQKMYVGTLEFSLPIFDRGSYARQAALAEKEAASYRSEQKHRDLQSQFDQTWAALLQHKKRIELYPTSLVSDLESQMNRAEQNWKKGLVQAPAFLELENQVHDQAVKVFDAQTDYIEALSQVQFLAGAEFAMEEK